MQKKSIFIVSLAILFVLVIAQVSFAAGSKEKETANDIGMSEMMQNANMEKMTEAMYSPEGEKMMQFCADFMDSYEKN